MTQFGIIHVTFDESKGPVLNLVFRHNITIPNAILQGVTTTLFTMAIGVGEPTGEPQISIIPVNVTDVRGRTLIFSFGVDEPSARGGQVIEAFMVFVRASDESHKDEDKLLKHSLPIVRVLKEGAEERIKLGKDSGFAECFYKISEALQRILLTDLCDGTQDDLSNLCTEREHAVVSNGSIRAIHNLDLTPELVATTVEAHRFLGSLGRSLTKYLGDQAHLALPLEFHGHTRKPKSRLIFFVESIELSFVAVITSGEGRTGTLVRPFKQILWDLNLSRPKNWMDQYPQSITPVYWPSDLATPSKQILGFDQILRVLSEYSNVLSCYSVFRVSEKSSGVGIPDLYFEATDPSRIEKHRATVGLFINLSRLCRIMTNGEELRDLTLGSIGPGMDRILILSWLPGYVMIGESKQGTGLLNLIVEQICSRLKDLD